MSDWEEAVKGRRAVKLLGGFNCYLTTDEENEWTEMLRATSEHARLTELMRVGGLLAIRLRAGHECRDELYDVAKACDELENQCFGIGKEWFAGLKERRAAADEV
jgi:hypothetical protein